MRHCCIVILMLGLCFQAHAQQKHSDGMDDALQYMPYASVFALKACGVESRDDWTRLAVTTAASWVASAGAAYVLKHSIKETRPDGTDQKSFPSGHATIAFAGATALHREFGKVSPWISVAGYGVATFVAIDRVAKDRHHWYDVAAGAAVGVAATEATWWLSSKVFKHKSSQVALGFSGNTLDVAVRF
ncbi:MAG: phosphatase PAP2 family protein [Prevotella sp.]|nr:phosphatase PAP2 family protein [Prevotella sp.]